MKRLIVLLGLAGFLVSLIGCKSDDAASPAGDSAAPSKPAAGEGGGGGRGEGK